MPLVGSILADCIYVGISTYTHTGCPNNLVPNQLDSQYCSTPLRRTCMLTHNIICSLIHVVLNGMIFCVIICSVVMSFTPDRIKLLLRLSTLQVIKSHVIRLCPFRSHFLRCQTQCSRVVCSNSCFGLVGDGPFPPELFSMDWLLYNCKTMLLLLLLKLKTLHA